MKTLLKRTLFILLFAILTLPFSAQCQGEGDPDTPVPIDGGLSLLIAAGVAYGAKKAYGVRKRKTAARFE